MLSELSTPERLQELSQGCGQTLPVMAGMGLVSVMMRPGIFKRSPFGQDLEIATDVRPCRAVVLAGRLLKRRGLFPRDHLQGLTRALLDADAAADALVLIHL